MFLDMVYEYFPLLKDEESVTKYLVCEKENLVAKVINSGNVVEGLMINVYEGIFRNHSKEITEKCFENFLAFDVKTLRKIKSEVILLVLKIDF